MNQMSWDIFSLANVTTRTAVFLVVAIVAVILCIAKLVRIDAFVIADGGTRRFAPIASLRSACNGDERFNKIDLYLRKPVPLCSRR